MRCDRKGALPWSQKRAAGKSQKRSLSFEHTRAVQQDALKRVSKNDEASHASTDLGARSLALAATKEVGRAPLQEDRNKL